MPTEQNDNTRVEYPQIPERQKANYKPIIKQDQLWDASKVKRFRNLQDFINSYRIYTRQLNYDPHNQREQIQYYFDKAKEDTEGVVLDLALSGLGRGIKYLTTPITDGGVETAVKMYRIPFTKVQKFSSITPKEMIFRTETAPAALKTKFVGKTKEGFKYTQPKVKKVFGKEEQKVLDEIEEIALKDNWTKVVHPNYDGRVYTKNGMYYLDLEGNVGRLGRQPVNYDPTLLTYDEFVAITRKNGGKLNLINKNSLLH